MVANCLSLTCSHRVTADARTSSLHNTCHDFGAVVHQCWARYRDAASQSARNDSVKFIVDSTSGSDVRLGSEVFPVVACERITRFFSVVLGLESTLIRVHAS